MVTIVETIILCIVFFLLCYLGTGTDEKNLKSYSSYPNEVQSRVNEIAYYQGHFKENNKAAAFAANFVLFLVLLYPFGLFIREKDFWHNFLALSIMGQGLNFFDLFVIDLLWWRNTKRIRFTKIPEKEYYQNPRKHIEAFGRALIMYLLVALIDGFLLTLF
ncbi:MAG: ABC transporter permease [Lachnospiraceae bacterium]|nr:ABC transporter permease [Lachnospiraceae bacterium]